MVNRLSKYMRNAGLRNGTSLLTVLWFVFLYHTCYNVRTYVYTYPALANLFFPYLVG